MGDMAEKQAKIKEKQENMAETNQKWQKTEKNYGIASITVAKVHL